MPGKQMLLILAVCITLMDAGSQLSISTQSYSSQLLIKQIKQKVTQEQFLSPMGTNLFPNNFLFFFSGEQNIKTVQSVKTNI